MAFAAALALAAVAAAPAALGDTHAEIVELFGSMTAALADDNGAGFMHGFDKNMPGYDKLKEYIDGLIRVAEATSDIAGISDEGDEQKRTVEMDWILDIRSREGAGPSVRREETVKMTVLKQNKRWRIVSIAPIDFFAPPNFSLAK
jgi:hypothetical protein